MLATVCTNKQLYTLLVYRGHVYHVKPCLVDLLTLCVAVNHILIKALGVPPSSKCEGGR